MPSVGVARADAEQAADGSIFGSADGLQRAHVPMAEAEAIELLAVHWGRSGSATRLATEKDDTFLIDATDGERYVLKISNPAEDPAEVDFEVRLLDHVAHSSWSVPVQRLLPAGSGDILISLQDEAGQQRQARLMSYVAGTPLDSLDSTPQQRGQIGRVLGHLRRATQTFSHPAQGRVLAWDVQHLLRLRPLLAEVADSAQRDLLEAGLSRFQHEVAAVIPTLRHQVLHNDFSKSNIIVDPHDPDFVQGVIDFGDAVHTAIAVDVSTALLNQLPRQIPSDADIDLFADGRDLLRGYLRVADLNRTELAVIPYLVMGRVVARGLITLYRARLMPHNARYILRNTEPGWAQLRWLLSRSDDYLTTTLLTEAEADR